MTEDDGRSLGRRKRREKRSPGGLVVASAERIDRRLRGGLEGELDRSNAPDPGSVAADVQDNRGEPRP